MAAIVSRILPLLSKAIPLGIAMKGLGKIDPRLEKFSHAAFGAGYTANEVLDFLRGKFESPDQQASKNVLKGREEAGTARPSEGVALKRIREKEAIPDALGQGLTGAAGIAGGLAALGLGDRNKSTSPEVLPPEVGYNPRQQVEDQRFAPQGVTPPSTINVSPIPEQQQQAAQTTNVKKARQRNSLSREALQEDVERQGFDKKDAFLSALMNFEQKLDSI